MAEEYDDRLCKEKHKNIGKEFEAVWKRINGTETKLWAIIILMVANLASLVVLLIKVKVL